MTSAYDYCSERIKIVKGELEIILSRLAGVLGTPRNPLEDGADNDLELRYRIERLEKVNTNLQKVAIPHELIPWIDKALKALDAQKNKVDRNFVTGARVHLHALAEKAASSFDEERTLVARALEQLKAIHPIISLAERHKRIKLPKKDLQHVEGVLFTLNLGLDDLTTTLKRIPLEEAKNAAA